MKLIVAEPAVRDTSAISSWYISINPELVVLLLDELDETYSLIAKYPFSGRRRRGNLFEIGLKLFPYIVLYELQIKPSEIVVH